MQQPILSIVIPVLNDTAALTGLLKELCSQINGLKAATGAIEIVVVDAGDASETAEWLAQFEAATGHIRYLNSPPGRAKQLNAGIECASGSLLWLLHADSGLPPGLIQELLRIAVNGEVQWGRFDVCLDDARWPFRVIEFFMNMRSRWTGICTGDQGIFLRGDLFQRVGGMPDQALMEDIELSKRLKPFAKPYASHWRLRTSARRWQSNGILATIFLMWTLRLLYFFKADPARLAEMYRA